MTEAIRKRQYTGDALKTMDAMSTVGIIPPGHFGRFEPRVKSTEGMSCPILSTVLAVV